MAPRFPLFATTTRGTEDLLAEELGYLGAMKIRQDRGGVRFMANLYEALNVCLKFLARLAAMVPPPRAHLVRYHGCLAPNAKMRPAVVPKRGAPTQAPQSQDKGAAAMGGRLDWATLLRRVYAVDVLQCPKCQGKLKVLAFLSDGPTVKKVLAHLGLPAEVAPLAPPRYAPEQLHLEPPYAGERAVGYYPASGPSCSQGPPSRLLLAA